MKCGACGYRVLTEREAFPGMVDASPFTLYVILNDRSNLGLHEEWCVGEFRYDPDDIAEAALSIARLL